MRAKGFTLLELMVVIIIIGILVIYSLPSMGNSLERSRGRNAEFNLIAVYSAQKRYLVSERKYFICDDGDIVNPDERLAAINQNLSLKIEDAYFEYSISKAGDGYRARAVRKDGRCVNKAMSVTEDNSTVNKKGCTAW
ncbi:MAG: prepilin-type N-terminal cleavage/methylation domain-containing protein [Candidatus Omnitrophica bacterium]|nr:prepilin-type N-terminal cleavage/methylation domain-containing protein [Candidatus Omnitrophota bacterium]